MLYAWLYPLHEIFPPFNVFRYITFRMMGGMLTATCLYFLLVPWLRLWIQRCQVQQQIREEGPASHKSKSGTPTMGGVAIWASVYLSVLLWMNFESRFTWSVLAGSLVLFAIGFVDDWRKVRRKTNLGLKGRWKLIVQLAVGLAFGWVLASVWQFPSDLTVPFLKRVNPDLGWIYIPFVALIVAGTSNAVNLTDGLDGLVTPPLMMAFITYAIFLYVSGHVRIASYLQLPYLAGVGEVTIICGAIVGALMGFLWHNSYPADLFMGDVGALPLGGVLGMVAALAKQELLLLLVGGLFVFEALSVMSQVLSFKIIGKRIFRMAPIHHHFELQGLAEPKIIVRFWIVSFILSLLGLATLKLR